ncbi:hypothetical protein DL96DRAFT_1812760 [Flagelloscypha sp. PMI_526]|nr:hypothetical protein DL96DRAFT_1812760 [Flagelloscypha sp. PMI_526]
MRSQVLLVALMPPSAPKRRYHHKSKAGCKNCRGRRVKCDETRPICNGCYRRKEACLWDSDDPPNNPLALILNPQANATLVQNSQFDLPPLVEFRKIDLELMHHWSTSTLQTFVPDVPLTRHGFQVLLPRLALEHDFLLHTIFALSSLHLHTCRPSEDYLRLAKMHCQRAILGLHKVGDSVPQEFIFLANLPISIYWLASPSWTANSQSGTPDLFDWFPVARTFMRRLGPYWEGVCNGIIADSQILPEDLTKEHKPPTFSLFPYIVGNIHREEVCPFDPEELVDPKVVSCYHHLIEKLSCMWNVFMNSNLQNTAIFLFPAGVRDEFLELFLQKRPRALILVAHYCALLSQFGSVWWYGEDRARSDIQRILSLLDSKWLPWMEYPLTVLQMEEGTIDRRLIEVIGLYGDENSSGSSGSSPAHSDRTSNESGSSYQSELIVVPSLSHQSPPYSSHQDIFSFSDEDQPSGTNVGEDSMALMALMSF